MSEKKSSALPKVPTELVAPMGRGGIELGQDGQASNRLATKAQQINKDNGKKK